MSIFLMAVLTVLVYLALAWFLAGMILGRVAPPKWVMFILGVIAVCLHAILLHVWIDLGGRQNLSMFNLVSLSLWLVSILTLGVMAFRQIDLLGVVVFPLAALSIVCVVSFPSPVLVQVTASPVGLVHILLAIVTTCVVVFSGFLALLLALEERLLRTKRVGIVLSKLPPLEAMEHLLFQAIATGFILLSIVLVTSFYFFSSLLSESRLLWHKSAFAVAAWLVFAVLLVGRLGWGWRGKRAIHITLFGVILLLLAYFGSHFLLGGS